MDDDTIAAISSPFGEGAIAVIRTSGPAARNIAATAFRGRADLNSCPPRTAHLGSIVGADGILIDHVLATVFSAPASYTGEDLVEIACHGGILVTREVFSRILECGARPADTGEFTRRAFLNGKLDLTQAEAVMDLIRARTDLALRSAAEQLEGTLGRDLNSLRAQLLAALAHVEAYIDFPEEDIGTASSDEIAHRLRSALTEITRLLDTATHGRVLRDGLRTVIAGPPNAGKSSLLNILLGFERAIVNESAGTTRDTIEEILDIKGIPVRLTDTAGIRESHDTVEREGIARTESALKSADLVIALCDGSTPPDGSHPFDFSPNLAVIRVLNKTDLGIHPTWRQVAYDLAISCSSRQGIGHLSQAIADRALGSSTTAVNPVAINARHQSCLKRAATALGDALASLESSLPPELTAIEIRSALDAVGEIVGKTDTEEILGEIFSSFCIGK